MRSSFITAAIVAVSTSSVYAYQCPDTTSINQSCSSISVFPLVCNNPNANKEACNAKQCNQSYIDNYAACQCRRNPDQFYEHSANVDGLLKRCGVAGLTNPYGSPVPVQKQSSKISGGAIAGIVIGCLAALAIAGLLAWCWRKKRHQHTAVYNEHSTYDNRGPTRTVVTEKIEPVVVKTGTTNFNTTTTPGTTTYSTTTTPVSNYPTGTNYHSTHPSTSYNTTASNTGYNSAYNVGRNVVDGAQNATSQTYNRR
ncbi:hypothetical protein BG000_000326 [Podila horticola]|nr:hypothetical protein BG000_000326 [Podila horticola]